MRIRYLRYFLVVAEELSFSRASARLNIEPSPLSRAIKELEAQLGVSLLHRRKGRIRLTWAGEVFQEEARRILSFIEDAKSRTVSASKGYRGRLRIGLADSLAQPRMAQLLARCREEEPLTEIRIVEMTLNEMLRALGRGQIDAGFTVAGEAAGPYRKERVWSEHPAIALPRRHPLLALEKISFRDMLPYPLILCHPETCASGHDMIRRWFSESALTLPVPAEFVSGHESMLMLVAAGYGIGIGLESQVSLYNHPEVIVRPAVEGVSLAETFIIFPEEPPSPELVRFIERARDIGGQRDLSPSMKVL